MKAFESGDPRTEIGSFGEIGWGSIMTLMHDSR
jgi:hypothetical protein